MDSSRIRDLLTRLKHIDTSLDILSVNTSIEAAHLGEQGRVVAVIAEEIHKLSKASEEIVKMLTKELAE